MDHNDRCDPSQQGAVVDFHRIDQGRCVGCLIPAVPACALSGSRQVSSSRGVRGCGPVWSSGGRRVGGSGRYRRRIGCGFLMGFETDVHIIGFYRLAIWLSIFL